MKFSPKLEQYRIRSGPYRTDPGDNFGSFLIDGPCGKPLRVMASSGDLTVGIAWEHVSVSLAHRPPNWVEMCHVKNLFWDEEETVMQLHPPKSKWISNHPYCLHMWRPLQCEIPLPPDITVGVKEAGELHSAEEAAALRERIENQVAKEK